MEAVSPIEMSVNFCQTNAAYHPSVRPGNLKSHKLQKFVMHSL
jgi:hypothetical protein